MKNPVKKKGRSGNRYTSLLLALVAIHFCCTSFHLFQKQTSTPSPPSMDYHINLSTRPPPTSTLSDHWHRLLFTLSPTSTQLLPLPDTGPVHEPLSPQHVGVALVGNEFSCVVCFESRRVSQQKVFCIWLGLLFCGATSRHGAVSSHTVRESAPRCQM